MEDLPADEVFHDLVSPLHSEDLAFDILRSGIQMAGDVPVVIVNEPMFISQGENSQIRYNFFYPRWAYDEYRQLISQEAARQGWKYVDLWDTIPASEFTNTAIHLTPYGSSLLAERILWDIISSP
jgi:hypothetical protein